MRGSQGRGLAGILNTLSGILSSSTLAPGTRGASQCRNVVGPMCHEQPDTGNEDDNTVTMVLAAGKTWANGI